MSRLWGKIHWRSGSGPVGEFLANYATLLRVAIVSIAFLILLEIFRAPSAEPQDVGPVGPAAS